MEQQGQITVKDIPPTSDPLPIQRTMTSSVVQGETEDHQGQEMSRMIYLQILELDHLTTFHTLK